MKLSKLWSGPCTTLCFYGYPGNECHFWLFLILFTIPAFSFVRFWVLVLIINLAFSGLLCISPSFPNIMLLFPISVYSCLLFVLKASVMVIFGFSLIFFSPLVTCLGFLWLSHLCWLHKPVSVSNPYLVLSVQFDPVLFGQRHRFL